MLNQLVLVGRICSVDNSGVVVVACPRSYKNENGVYDTDFIKVNLSGSITHNVLEYCKKGDVVGIKGRIECDTTDSDMKIIGEKVSFLSSNNSNN